MAAVYEVVGGRQLRASLKAAGDDLTDLKTIHKQAATLAANRARQIAPDASGRLKATIRAAGTKTAGIVRVGNNTTVRYAQVIHWGWFRRHIPENPFASTGAQESEPVWLALYSAYVERTLNTIEGK